MNLQRRKNCRHKNIEIDTFKKNQAAEKTQMLIQQKARKVNLNFKYDSINSLL